MRNRSLGSNAAIVSLLGLGAMGMSELYGPADEAESRAVLGAALDAGITLIDTADFYGAGHNESLIADAISGRAREAVVLSVKFGAMRDPGGGWTGYDARPSVMKNALAYSLRRLKTDYIDIYRAVRVDPNIPIEEVIGAMAQMVKAGYVRHIGLSEASAQTIRRAAGVHPICDVQFEYSLGSRSIETAVLPTCRELGIGVTAYGVLGRGLFSGHWSAERAVGKEYRNMTPRFRGENLERNLLLVESLRTLAAGLGATVAQVAIAWVLARGEDIVPLIGARTRAQLQESLGAADLQLSSADLARIDELFPEGGAYGERYPRGYLSKLDSERSEEPVAS